MTRARSLQRKFVQTLLLVSALIAIPTLVVVSTMSVQTSAANLSAVQRHIEAGIRSKGKVLTENHALALRGLTLDNAFTDMQGLLGQAIEDDPELVYGIYVDADLNTLAYCQRGQSCGKLRTPDKDAWKNLGLTAGQALVMREQVRRARVLGTDVLEVAVPVAGEEAGDPPLGTIRYGLSTERMSRALADAQKASDQALSRSLSVLVSCIVLATLVGLLLSRRQAVKTTRPVSKLTEAANQLARGNRKVRVEVRSGDEFQQLGASFNTMVEQLDVSYNELEEMNRTLERRVQERTSELAAKNRDMRLVLDNVDQGFITLSAKGIMASERSWVVDEWFGKQEGTESFWQFTERVSESFAAQFRLGWEQLVAGILPLSLCLSQLPSRLVQGSRTFKLTYMPFTRGETFEGMLVIVADITVRLAHEREEAAQQELMQSFKRLMLDRRGFATFLADADAMVHAICSGRLEKNPIELKRTLHTLKGNTATMGLGVMAKLCHALEDQLAYAGEPSADLLCELEDRWGIIRSHVANFVGDAAEQRVEIPLVEFNQLVAEIAERGDPGGLREELLKWRLEPISRYFERLAEQARALADRLGKGAINVQIDASDLRVDADRWGPLFSELVHAVRNAVDHGLESTSERTKLGKSRTGTLVLRARRYDQRLVFELKDDGKGIRWELVRQRARALGLPHSTHAELVDALCFDGLTTRDSASQVSGRGVGMAALKSRVVELGGSMDVISAEGAGATVSLSFPLTGEGDVFPERPRSARGASRRSQRPESSRAGRAETTRDDVYRGV